MNIPAGSAYDEQRFWAHVEIHAGDECWPWTGRLDKDGYGQLYTGDPPKRKQTRAHIFAFELATGIRLAPGEIVHHRCHYRRCVRFHHLKRTTRQRHMSEDHRTPRRTHCRRGHALVAEHVLMRRDGGRICRLCRRAYIRVWMRAKRAHTRQQRAMTRH
jgi:HNH endonuclease